MSVITSDGRVIERIPWMEEAATHLAAALRAVAPHHTTDIEARMFWERYRYALDSAVFWIGTIGGPWGGQVAEMVVEEGVDFAEALEWGEAQQQAREDALRAEREPAE